MTTRHLSIFDTTLRDGDQAAGFAFLPDQKIALAQALDNYGVDIIEAGFPCSSEQESAVCKKIAALPLRAHIAVMSRCIPADIIQTAQIFSKKSRAKNIIHLSLPASTIQIHAKMKKTPEQMLSLMENCIYTAKNLCSSVEIGFEDASRADRGFLTVLCKRAIKAGAGIINIADTTGYLLPDEMTELVRFLMTNIPEFSAEADDHRTILGIHCHNDQGLALATALAGITAGASQVDVTIAGLGERAGNVALEELSAVLVSRAEHLSITTGIHPELTGSLCKLLFSLTGTSFSPLKPVTGYNTNAHASGLHQQGLLEDQHTYIANKTGHSRMVKQRIILSRHSGHAGVVLFLENFFGKKCGTQEYSMQLDLVLADIKKAGASENSVSVTEVCTFLYKRKLSTCPPYQFKDLPKILKEHPAKIHLESISGFTLGSGETKYRIYREIILDDTIWYAIERTGSNLARVRKATLLDAENALYFMRLYKQSTNCDNQRHAAEQSLTW
jgi:2-isopropylmalate synthase